MYMCVLCIFIMHYKYTHMHVYISEKMYAYMLNIFIYNIKFYNVNI